MQPLRQFAIAVMICLIPIASTRAAEQDLAPLLKTIQSIGAEGKGNREATQAWRQLSQTDAVGLPAILAALDTANPLAANWLRSAVEAIADREFERKGKLPVEALENFIQDTKHDPRGRRLAFELVSRVDPGAPDRLIPKMLNDPSVEFRRDAVTRLVDEAAKLDTAAKPDEAKATYLQALGGARDQDQVEAIVKALEKYQYTVDLPVHFGFVMDWKLIGPFDNTGNKGFDIPYPPEAGIDLEAKYVGQKGEVAWVPYNTDEKYGIVDLAKAQAPHKGAVDYAVTEFTSDAARPVELRLGTPNAWKVWVNGTPVFGRGEYHRGMQIDQYVMQAELKPGKNTILIKICQNEQTEEWAQRWQFQLRVCDSAGTAILSKTRPAITKQTASAADEGKK